MPYVVIFVFVGFLCSMTMPLKTYGALADPSMDFTTVASNCIPAVVSIRTKETSDAKTRGHFYSPESNENDPLDMFHHFFGIPRYFQEKNPYRQQQPIPKQPQAGQASGFIISSEGVVVTNSHVVHNTSEVTVILNDGREFTGKVIGEDPHTDVAVVKIEGNDLPYLDLGDSEDLKVGQWVVAIGNPLGLQASLTAGVVSAKGRNNLDIARVEDFIQTDTVITRGNSGGPLLNLNGEVVGVNTAIITTMAGAGYSGIGFAIPSNMVKHVVGELLSTGRFMRGFLGLTLQQIDYELSQALGLDKAEGALVADVQRGSPAEKSGMKQGDVILKYDTKTVNNFGTFRNAISLMKPGSKVKLEILRDGRKVSVPVVIGNFPGDKGGDLASSRDVQLGLNVEKITPSIAQNLGYLESKGVIVTKVDPGSVAAWAGFKKGMIIRSVNQREISNPDEFYQKVRETPDNKPILFLIHQGDNWRYLSMRMK